MQELYQMVLDMGKCELIPCNQDENPEFWLATRTTGIGGSDAGAVCGLSKWATPLSVYLAKKDLSKFEGNAFTEYGHRMEPVIREWSKEDLGCVIEEVPGMFKSREHDFMNANLDGLIYFEEEKKLSGVTLIGLGGHEIKESSGEGFTDEGDVPDQYYAQVQHYMQVTGLNWFILTAHINGKPELKHYPILRDEAFISEMVNKETDFWENYVLTDTAPAPTGTAQESDAVKQLPMAEEIEIPDEYSYLFEEREEIEAQIKELEAKSEALKSQILLKMYSLSDGAEDSEKVTAYCGGWKVTYNQQTRKSVDTNEMKKAGIYDDYCKETLSKVMRISKPKAAV